MYADLLYVKNDFISIPHDKTGPKYGFYRDPENMAKFISNFYEEAKVSPLAVEYVEALGSGNVHIIDDWHFAVTISIYKMFINVTREKFKSYDNILNEL